MTTRSAQPHTEPRVGEPSAEEETARLAVLTIAGDARRTLVLSGELDLATRPRLDRAFALLVGDVSVVVLDLGGLTFMDSTGLHAIICIKELCAERDWQFSLIRASRQVHRLLELSGVLDQLPSAPDVPEG
jgi:anti-anti-sigma factor